MTAARPVRLQLSRRKGSNLQALSLATNGLPAVNCARPGKWGNPDKIAPAFESEGVRFPAITAEIAVAMHRQRWERALEQWPSARQALAELRGRNLACYCGLSQPCHVDFYLERANAPICEAV